MFRADDTGSREIGNRSVSIPKDEYRPSLGVEKRSETTQQTYLRSIANMQTGGAGPCYSCPKLVVQVGTASLEAARRRRFVDG